jgi:ATP-grasp domain
VFGPLVVFGLGGAAAEVRADHSARLTPLTDTDADQLIGAFVVDARVKVTPYQRQDPFLRKAALSVRPFRGRSTLVRSDKIGLKVGTLVPGTG